MPKVAFPVEASSTKAPVFETYASVGTLTWMSGSSETVTFASLDTITLWPPGISSSTSAYPLPSETESSSVAIVTTAYPEPSQESLSPPPAPEQTTTTTTTSIKTTIAEYPPPSSSFSSPSSLGSVQSTTGSVTLPTGETSVPPNPPHPTETSSATVGVVCRVGFAMLMLGVVHVFVGMC